MAQGYLEIVVPHTQISACFPTSDCEIRSQSERKISSTAREKHGINELADYEGDKSH